jgi:molybdenum cofactor cytidylyltransferase
MASVVTDGAVIVVLGADALRLRGLLQRHGRKLTIVHNARWRDGMAGSLRAGLARVPPRTDGLLILLVDQARVDTGDLLRLAKGWQRRPGRPAAAHYEGRAAVPAIIPRRHFAALRTLEGDTGARQLLQRLDGPSLVSMPKAAFDIDTPQDLAALLN